MSRQFRDHCEREPPPDLLPDDAAAMEAAFGGSGFDAEAVAEREEHEEQNQRRAS